MKSDRKGGSHIWSYRWSWRTRAWAQAGAKGIILAGRTELRLKEPSDAVKKLSPSTKVIAVPTEVTSEQSVKSVFETALVSFERIDVVMNACGVMNNGHKTGEIEPSQWFRDFEVNVKGSYNIAHNFIKSGGGQGTIIFIVSMGASFTVPGISSYSASKLSVIKLAEYLDAEHPQLRVFAIHPGILQQTETKRGMVVDTFTPFARDKGIMTGGITLYFAGPTAEHLRGCFFSANWELDETAAHKEEIIDQKLLKLSFLHAKLSPEGHPWGSK
ncbi:hypothetical protein BGW36DRAFT_412153 [Talaromyces proteolyticus]|uniref:NAD(P)-binding protein n=1 Tax=Talaromyces proteolyticus TaxID=1131652 RepID=A0AAD4KDV6_9EURO|nr:uncharacterized protein BGW36DRAFT_412153 [Talaromyces proteolyticus]KAH8689313.1 hypothetical protein BGW36DRAFT_412153 [Talaromyces proteolyticus]